MRSIDVRAVANALYIHSGMNPHPPCWIVGSDESLDFCRACADARHAKGEGEFVASSCGHTPESDITLACYDCGEQLAYWLTEYGVEEELDHFGRKRFRGPPLSGDAYCIARVLDSAPEDTRVKRLAARVAKHLPGRA